MKDKLVKILYLFFLFFPKSFSHATTGNFSLGVHAKTTRVFNANKALRDYYVLKDAKFNVATETILLKGGDNSENFLKISKLPIVAGIDFEYSCYFTDKLGLSFHGNWGMGNVLVMGVDKKSKEYESSSANVSSNDDFNSEDARKISVMDLEGDLRLKYDIFNSSLDFNDYTRNSLVISASLGFKLNWLLLREFCSFNDNVAKNTDDSGKDKPTNDSSSRINFLFPGIVLGVDILSSINIGLGIDGCYFFRNLFTKNDTLVGADEKYAQGRNFVPSYQTNCHFFQVGLRIYYDFGAFINNHEAPSEIDIEKW